MEQLPIPPEESIIYSDDKLYACLALYPVTKGHVIVVWKKPAKDLHLLNDTDYDYLMDKVDQVRNALLKALELEKIYLLYMDEIKQVHWHLIPRYNEKGLNMFEHDPKKISDFSLAEKIKKHLLTN